MEVIEPDMMTQAERAKQFAPFDAMKGLQEALRDREERHARVERHDISEEDIERNSSVLAKLTNTSTYQPSAIAVTWNITIRNMCGSPLSPVTLINL